MNRRQLIDFLNSLEAKYPVNTWKTSTGYELWPYIKIKLFFHFRSGKTIGDPKSEKKPKSGLIQKALKGVPIFFDLYFKKSNSHYLFCEASHFKQKKNEQYKTRYYNQLVSTAKTGGKDFLFLQYETLVEDFETKVDFPDKTMHLHKITPLFHFLKRVTYLFKRPKINDSNSLIKLVKEINLQTKNEKQFSLEDLKQDLIYIDILRRFFKRILHNNNIKEVYILCYYNRLMFPMVMACKDLDIPTIDIQHGGQGDSHVAYSNFNSVPKNGYGMLPKKFWCWDEGSASVLRNWINHQKYHEVEIKGNPWLDFRLDSYEESNGDKKKIILYTMQPEGNELLEDYLIKVIKKTPDDFSWWLRLHPRQLDQKRQLNRILEENQIKSKVEVDKALDHDLPYLLKICHLHISKFSGSILEAFLLHKKSIIIDKIGEEMFPEVLKSDYGVSVTTQNSEELLREILQSEKINFKEKSSLKTKK